MLRPDSAAVHNNLGVAFYDEGRVEEATEQYRKAVELLPDYGFAHLSLGDILSDKHQWGDALAEYTKGFHIQPEDANDYYGFAWTDVVTAADIGKDQDATQVGVKERSLLRTRGRLLLRAALNLWTKKLNLAKMEDRTVVMKALERWQKVSYFASVRDEDALAKLPADEQDAWRKLWADVDALLKKAQEK